MRFPVGNFVVLYIFMSLISSVRLECRPPSERDVHNNFLLTRILHHHVKMWQLSNSKSISKGPQLRSLALLDTVNQIAKAACPDQFVSHQFFLDSALQTFHVLRSEIFGNVQESNVYFQDLVSPSLFQRIHPILMQCRTKIQYEKNIRFRTDPDLKDCSGTGSVVIRQICYQTTDLFVCKDLESRNANKTTPNSCHSGEPNLILDVVWNTVDLVHGLCLQNFISEDDLTAFHLWEQAMESLFNKPILDYWYKSDLSTDVYQQILHPLAVQQFYNLEMCVEGMYYLSSGSEIPRLQRPVQVDKIYRRRKRSTKYLRHFKNNLLK